MNNIICHNVIKITKEGITLESVKGRIYINLYECARNFSAEKGNKFCTGVATRDITTLSFTFYTRPKTNIVFKKNLLRDLVTGKSAVSKFLNLQKAIVEVGYTSYDIS